MEEEGVCANPHLSVHLSIHPRSMAQFRIIITRTAITSGLIPLHMHSAFLLQHAAVKGSMLENNLKLLCYIFLFCGKFLLVKIIKGLNIVNFVSAEALRSF